MRLGYSLAPESAKPAVASVESKTDEGRWIPGISVRIGIRVRIRIGITVIRRRRRPRPLHARAALIRARIVIGLRHGLKCELAFLSGNRYGRLQAEGKNCLRSNHRRPARSGH